MLREQTKVAKQSLLGLKTMWFVKKKLDESLFQCYIINQSKGKRHEQILLRNLSTQSCR